MASGSQALPFRSTMGVLLVVVTGMAETVSTVGMAEMVVLVEMAQTMKLVRTAEVVGVASKVGAEGKAGMGVVGTAEWWVRTTASTAQAFQAGTALLFENIPGVSNLANRSCTLVTWSLNV